MKRYEVGLTVGLVVVLASAASIAAGLAWEWAPVVALFMGGAAASTMRADF